MPPFVRVGQQRVVEPVLVGELLLLLHRVDADTHSTGARLGELGLHVPEVAALLGAPRCHRGGIEEQDDRAVRHEHASVRGVPV